MPLTKKGAKIKRKMTKTYGKGKGNQVCKAWRRLNNISKPWVCAMAA